MKNPIKWLTRELRVRQALKYIPAKNVHVDIGCGIDKYLLQKSPCCTKLGFDKKLGHIIDHNLSLENNTVDCITMLAVIEHLEYPFEIIKECYRVLKDDGILIITTPKAKGFWIMNLYAPNFEDEEGEHKQHYDYDSLCTLVKDIFNIRLYKEFELRYNQLLVCTKNLKSNGY